jgi:hypothetical protein
LRRKTSKVSASGGRGGPSIFVAMLTCHPPQREVAGAAYRVDQRWEERTGVGTQVEVGEGLMSSSAGAACGGAWLGLDDFFFGCCLARVAAAFLLGSEM